MTKFRELQAVERRNYWVNLHDRITHFKWFLSFRCCSAGVRGTALETSGFSHPEDGSVAVGCALEHLDWDEGFPCSGLLRSCPENLIQLLSVTIQLMWLSLPKLVSLPKWVPGLSPINNLIWRSELMCSPIFLQTFAPGPDHWVF